MDYWQPFEAPAEKSENTIHMSKIPLHGWWAWKNWFLDTKKIFVPALFGSFFTYHGSKKWPEPKKLLTCKITFFMSVNHVKEYLMFVDSSAVYSHFLSELQTAPISFCLKINAPKLFQGFMITYYLVISRLLVDSPKVGMI